MDPIEATTTTGTDSAADVATMEAYLEEAFAMMFFTEIIFDQINENEE